jgi:hypothetical protein
MIRMSSPLRKSLSHAALAVSLVVGGVGAAIAVPGTAIAQEKPKFSKDWREAAKPLDAAVAKITADAEAQALAEQIKAADDAARAPLRQQLNTALGNPLGSLDAISAVATTADDQYYTGNYILQLGQAMYDTTLQSRGLQMMINSGKVPAEQLGLYNYYVGAFAYDAKDWQTARTYLRQAIDAGYYENNVERRLAETYFMAGDNEGGYTVVRELTQARRDAGSTPPEALLTRALNLASKDGSGPGLADQASLLVEFYPQHWHDAIILTMTGYGLQPEETLDLFRLMSRTNSFKNEIEYFEYVDNLDPRKLSNEVLAALDEGVASGVLSASNSRVAEYRSLANTRASTDRNEAAQIEKEARSAPTGVPARASGDVYLSIDNGAKAEEMYKLALEKGGVDRDRILTRVGISQVEQGKWAEARETFAQIDGRRLPVAKLWLTYIDQEAPETTPTGG